MKRILIILILAHSAIAFSFGQSHLDSLSMANRLYSEGKFDKAAQLYESVLKMGYESPELYYNLGNAYFKQQRIASAILNFERAALRNPSDEDIQFNLKLAHSFTVDRIEPIPTFFYQHGLLHYHGFHLTHGHTYQCFSLLLLLC